MEREVDKQVAAPAETRTTQLAPSDHRSSKKCGWKSGDSGELGGRKTLSNEKTKEPT
jgi:hypothetical protein